MRKMSPPPEFDPRTVQPVASRYTVYDTRPLNSELCASLFIGLALSGSLNVTLFYICNTQNPHNPKRIRDWIDYCSRKVSDLYPANAQFESRWEHWHLSRWGIMSCSQLSDECRRSILEQSTTALTLWNPERPTKDKSVQITERF